MLLSHIISFSNGSTLWIYFLISIFWVYTFSWGNERLRIKRLNSRINISEEKLMKLLTSSCTRTFLAWWNHAIPFVRSYRQRIPRVAVSLFLRNWTLALINKRATYLVRGIVTISWREYILAMVTRRLKICSTSLMPDEICYRSKQVRSKSRSVPRTLFGAKFLRSTRPWPWRNEPGADQFTEPKTRYSVPRNGSNYLASWTAGKWP